MTSLAGKFYYAIMAVPSPPSLSSFQLYWRLANIWEKMILYVLKLKSNSLWGEWGLGPGNVHLRPMG